jgi:hypothetical protein
MGNNCNWATSINNRLSSHLKNKTEKATPSLFYPRPARLIREEELNFEREDEA